MDLPFANFVCVQKILAHARLFSLWRLPGVKIAQMALSILTPQLRL